MLREITKAIGPRFKPGNTHDYPKGVWDKIAVDARMNLDDFSKVIGHNPAHQSMLKGRGAVQHKRLGT